jgi:hypothetical protein
VKLILENWREYLAEEEDYLLLESSEMDLLKEGILPEGLLKKLLEKVKASMNDNGALEKILNAILKLPVVGPKIKELLDALVKEIKILKALFSEDKSDVEELEEGMEAIKKAYDAVQLTAGNIQTMDFGEYLETSPRLKKYRGTAGRVLWVALLALGIYMVSKNDTGVLGAVLPAAFDASNIAMSDIVDYAIGASVEAGDAAPVGRREDEQE